MIPWLSLSFLSRFCSFLGQAWRWQTRQSHLGATLSVRHNYTGRKLERESSEIVQYFLYWGETKSVECRSELMSIPETHSKTKRQANPARHDKPNEPAKAGPLSFVLFSVPIRNSFNSQQGPPLFSLSGGTLWQYQWYGLALSSSIPAGRGASFPYSWWLLPVIRAASQWERREGRPHSWYIFSRTKGPINIQYVIVHTFLLSAAYLLAT